MTNTTAPATARLVAPLCDRVQVLPHTGFHAVEVGLIRYGVDGDPDEPEFDTMNVPVPLDILCQIDDILTLRGYLASQVGIFAPLWAYHSMTLSCPISCGFGPEPF